MSEQEVFTTACSRCGSETTEAVAHLGSYYLRCAVCGHAIVATSLIAILEQRQGSLVEATLDYREDRSSAASIVASVVSIPISDLLTRTPTISGPLQDVADTILAIAAKGVHLVLEFRDARPLSSSSSSDI